MSISSDLFARALKVIPGGVNSPVRAFRGVGGTPFFTESAEGCRLHDADGRQYIDYVCTWGPAIHGHNHHVIHEALRKALDRGTSFGTPCEDEVMMAETLTRLVPGLEKVRMVNSGTEATMSAIRLARGCTGRSKIIKFAGCYHGHSDSLLIKAGSGALTHGHPDSAGVPAAFAAETIVLQYNNVQAVEDAFAANKGEIACIILEPCAGNMGVVPAKEGYLEALRELCTANGTILIFDEVMSGFRVALGGVQELSGVRADLITMGKIIGGGLPVGAFGGRANLMDMLAPNGPVYQAGTLSGNPLAMAAGLASLNLLEKSMPYARLDAAGARIETALLAAAEDAGVPLQINRSGSMWCPFFNESPVHSLEDAMKGVVPLYAKFFHSALDKGVYLPPSQFETCFISTAHDEAAISRTIEILCESITSL
ncbi:MAG: glutamate-1-semialdehyde 2,1-aminomutase [Opitutales bacterium]|nr:glutamate-1-semialdehyde 2,1-aminomutase [Opitutales bacterium]